MTKTDTNLSPKTKGESEKKKLAKEENKQVQGYDFEQLEKKKIELANKLLSEGKTPVEVIRELSIHLPRLPGISVNQEYTCVLAKKLHLIPGVDTIDLILPIPEALYKKALEAKYVWGEKDYHKKDYECISYNANALSYIYDCFLEYLDQIFAFGYLAYPFPEEFNKETTKERKKRKKAETEFSEKIYNEIAKIRLQQLVFRTPITQKEIVGLSFEDIKTLAKMWNIDTSFLGENVGEVKYNDYAYNIMNSLLLEITQLNFKKQSIKGRIPKLVENAETRFMKEILTLKLFNKAGFTFDITTEHLEAKKRELNKYVEILHKKVVDIKTIKSFLLDLTNLMDSRAKEII